MCTATSSTKSESVNPPTREKDIKLRGVVSPVPEHAPLRFLPAAYRVPSLRVTKVVIWSAVPPTLTLLTR